MHKSFTVTVDCVNIMGTDFKGLKIGQNLHANMEGFRRASCMLHTYVHIY